MKILSEYNDYCLAVGEPVIGEDCWIGPFTVLDASGGLTIGSNCSISAGVHIYSHDSVDKRRTRGREGCVYSPTKIGDWVYIGPHTVIAKGVTVGNGAIIGANSFVNRDIPAGAKVYGTPVTVQRQPRV